MANFIRNVLIDGVKYAVGDKRIEGDNFAYIQVPEAITVGTNLTDLAPIQKALDSTDGSLLYVPSLNALFSPTASSDPTIRIWSSTVGDKGYQLKATLNASGILQSAVINEASAEAGLIITDAEWSPVLQQYLGKDPADFDPTGTYLITDEAKAIANKLITINMVEHIVKSPDKFQIEIEAMLSSFANCVFNDFSQTDMAATFKVLGNVPYVNTMSGNVESLDLDIIGPKLKNNGTIAGLIIKEPQPSEDDIIIEYTDVAALQSATTDPYTPVTTAAAKELGGKIYNNPRKRIFVHYNMGAGTDFYQELKPTAPFPVNFESEGDLAYIFADLSEDGYNMCIRVFVGPVDIEGATACPHYMAVSDYALICDNSETTSNPFLTDDVSIWIGKSLRTNCFGLSAAGGTDRVFYKRIVDKADFTGTGAKYYDTFTYELDRKFTSPGSGKNYTSSKNINVYYNNSLEVVGILVVDPPKNESVAFNISTDDYEDIKYDTENLTTDPYVTTDLAKSIGKKLLGHFKNPEGFDIDHFTVSKMPTSANAFDSVPISFYTYTDHTAFNDDIAVIKFTTTAEIFNGDITVFYNKSDSTEALGMRIDPKPEEFVRISKKYMEIEVDTPETTLKANVTGDTLNLFSVQPVAASKIIHYPESVLFTSDNAFELKFAPDTAAGSDPYTPNAKIEISKDGLNWTQPTWDETNGITLKADTLNPELGKYSVFIKSDNYINEDDSSVFGFSKFSEVSGSNIEVSGILDSLWGGKAPNGFECKYMFDGMVNLTTAKDLAFPTTVGFVGYANMFSGCTSLTQAPTLPATTLQASCYQEMFSGCTSLTQAPVLPATTLASQCYTYMFQGCTALTQAPVLPATTLAQKCYMQMFSGCTSLTQAPALPATVLAKQCYESMFNGCTSLTQAPALPATTLVQYCYYQMFQGCTALTQAPELPATDFVNGNKAFCYQDMFKGCTSLTKPVFFPVLDFPTSATTDGSMFNSMFEGCTGIKWATSGTPYIIKTTDGAVVSSNPHLIDMFKGNGGTPLPETTGTPKTNTTYYLAV